MNNLKYDLDFTIPLSNQVLGVKIQSQSSRVSLQAPSGAGKSSFLRAILKLNKKVKGRNFISYKIIGYVPQDSLLIPTMSIKENLLLSPRAEYSLLREVTYALSITHLIDRYPRMLSGGEKQRVSIARALLSMPELLILDEPFAALDKKMKITIIEFLRKWIEKNKIDLLLVSHDESSANQLCNEFWTIEDDQLIIDHND